MSSDIADIISGNEESAGKALENFIDTQLQTFSFPDLNHNEQRQRLWDALLKLATTSTQPKVISNCFTAIRILSREKTSLNELVTEEWLELIKKHSGLTETNLEFNADRELIAVEASKALCNVIFNSSVAAALCSKNQILELILERMRRFSDQTLPSEIKFFDMKIVFLITALCSEVRNRMKGEMKGLVYLTEALEAILKETAESLPQKSPQFALNDKQVEIVCEILKALFNLTIFFDTSDEEENQNFSKLAHILRMYLLIPTLSNEKTHLLRNNVVNLLTNMDDQHLLNLVTEIGPEHKVPERFRFEDKNMTAFYEILMFLEEKFSEDPTVSKQLEMLSPVISVLLKSACADRSIRKYLKEQILPPLTDVRSRPEQGNTLRNSLCRILTSPITQLGNMAAELLFVLCKMNVNRMIKYTGYGNAAGLLAKRGLLGGKSDSGEAEFSEDEDSETEEYAALKNKINPVTGCYEEPHPSPMANMTEEQKLYEAMKLVELIDNLTKQGTIKPCRIGADGKPQPIEHVLQLQECLKAQQVRNEDDSDSD